MTIKFEVKNRFTGVPQFTAEIECAEDAPVSIKLGSAVKWALKMGANLSGANLSDANLSDANLTGADLSGANLSGADLSGAALFGANLSRADLSRADLSRADLSHADLSHADLSRANLSDADLSGAYLSRADLSRADLSHADLLGVDLSGAALSGAHLTNAKGLHRFQITPSEGAFVGWKKLRNGVIARLVIPHDAERINAYSSRKCRASYAVVHELFGAAVGRDRHSGALEYRAGHEVRPDKWDPDRSVECSNGIHFFITREEAEEY